jgi:hypothetical protein
MPPLWVPSNTTGSALTLFHFVGSVTLATDPELATCHEGVYLMLFTYM